MDSRHNPNNMSMGDGSGLDWNDMFNAATTQFDDSMPLESSYGNAAFHDFTNLDTYNESPAGLPLRTTTSKQGQDAAAIAGAQNPQPSHMANAVSAESSSQDSSSDSSSRRKRRPNDSESPISDSVTEIAQNDARIKQEDMGMANMRQVRSYDSNFAQPMHNLSLGQALNQGENKTGQFDFSGSAASSPIQTRDFNSAMSLDAHMNISSAARAARYPAQSPQTINPGMFTIGDSRDHSPATNNMMMNQTTASPHGIFSTPSSDSPDAYANNQNWNAPLTQNPAWPGDFTNQLNCPSTMAITPSPGASGSTPGTITRGPMRCVRSPLHIAPISAKSRVETQINVVMTLEQPPPGLEHLHLPLHTIAKSKLLAKEEVDISRCLELHTMLVCTSAMHNSQHREKALEQAATASNEEIQRRAELAREMGDEEKNDPRNVLEEDKPASGGEVKICSNCIQRERKRAGRKKTKREEEQQHWERFETERVVVFNSNEFLPFKPCEPGYQPQKEGEEPYLPPDGALCVSAAMRIACYCRHQSEKEGFQVIFTLKDRQGNVVAQQMSDSILITDDHKTHPPSFSTTVPGDGYYQNAGFLPNGLPISHSMVDIASHVQPFASSRSAGNLQQLAYQGQYGPGHAHQLSGSGYASQTTSATMTPTSLSRPGSPTNAGQAGPNKKRKSGTFHRKIPSGLTMTPRVDTSQPPSSNMPSAVSMSSQFSPSLPMNQGYMTIPNNNGPAQFYGSGPPTPNENGPFNFSQPQVDVSRMNNQAYFSHPSSAVPSRASSPVLQQTRTNMAAYARQHPNQSAANTTNIRADMFATQVQPSPPNDSNRGPFPVINQVIPAEGPVTGGNEVAILGEHFVPGTMVSFGDHIASTTHLSSSSLKVRAPPGRMGGVYLALHPPAGPQASPTRYPDPPNRIVYTYVQNNEQTFILALKWQAEQQFGSPDMWQNLAQSSATSFLQAQAGRTGMQQQGHPGMHRMAAGSAAVEEMVLDVLDGLDQSPSARESDLDLSGSSGASMLSLASSRGMNRVVAGLLARGANVDARDHGGYTPLMHAALQGHSNVFRLLISRGADPASRSLTGYSAIDLVSPHQRDDFVHILWSTERRRHSRPTLRSRLSYGSAASSKASWDMLSVSYYESEVESSEQSLHSRGPSRRPSTQASLFDVPLQAAGEPSSLSPYTAMAAWRDALAAQIHQFQEAVHWNLPCFQLPPLPNLADCRRLSSLVPRKKSTTPPPPASTRQTSLESLPTVRPCWNVFSNSAPTSPPSTAPPPAYHEIFPERVDMKTKDPMQDDATRTAVVDAVADEKCATMFEERSCCTKERTADCCFSSAVTPSKPENGILASWLRVSFGFLLARFGSFADEKMQMALLVMSISMLVRLVVVPHIMLSTTIPATTITELWSLAVTFVA